MCLWQYEEDNRAGMAKQWRLLQQEAKRDEAERAETYVKAYEAKNVIVDAYALLLCLHWTWHHKRST